MRPHSPALAHGPLVEPLNEQNFIAFPMNLSKSLLQKVSPRNLRLLQPRLNIVSSILFVRYQSSVAQAKEDENETDDAHNFVLKAAPTPADLKAAMKKVIVHQESQAEFTTDGTIPARWRDSKDVLDPLIMESMNEIFKYKTMSKVQEAIVQKMPIQTDLLVRSKTGTGKTLGFLVPALQRTYENFKAKGLTTIPQMRTYGNENASVFIVSPTRELANQIAAEARRLMQPAKNMKAHSLVGGDSKRMQLRLMERERNDILVGTPGRLLDLCESVPAFQQLLEGVHTLVLDEADTLLEMGFKKELDAILSYLPKERQTYMFSATVSPEIKRIARMSLKSDYAFINTVGENDQDVHQQIKQQYIIRPTAEHLRTVLSLIITEQMRHPEGKVIVFLPTTKMTILYSSLFKYLRRLYQNQHFQQFDIHALKSQERRSKTSAAFRTANTGAVLFTTDVSARGIDYPGVTLVLQVGSPGTRDQYIHRVGRTGRAGKTGEGILLLAPFEASFTRVLGRDIPITEMEFPDSEIALGDTEKKVFALSRQFTDEALVSDAFLSLAGSYLPRCSQSGWDRRAVQEQLETWYESFECRDAPPPIPRHLLGGGGGSSRGGSGRSFGGFGGGRGGYGGTGGRVSYGSRDGTSSYGGRDGGRDRGEGRGHVNPYGGAYEGRGSRGSRVGDRSDKGDRGDRGDKVSRRILEDRH